MICKECSGEGKTSKVFVGATMSTCMGFSTFYDEKGEYHSHDPNRNSTNYWCSGGHRWTESQPNHCPALNCSFGRPVATPRGGE